MGAKFLLLALLVPAAMAADPCAADQNNGFELDECGNDKSGKQCCHPTQQVCLEGKPLDKDEIFECSTNRALYGMKVVTVLIIPILASVFLLAAFIIMAKQVKNMAKPKPALAILCLPQTLLSIVLAFSPLWKFGLYSAFVAVVVFFMMKVKGNKWVVLAIITLQIFNLLAAMGAYGSSGVFVPVGLLSADNVHSWEAGAIDTMTQGMFSGPTCSAYYGGFFNVEAVELANEEADPAVKFYGYCSDSTLALMGSVVMAKIVFQMFMLLFSIQLMVDQLGGGENERMKAAD